MIQIDKTIYYYFILLAILLFCFSFIPLIFEIFQKKITSNIPYLTLILLMISFLIFLFVTFSRQYYYHFVFYLIGFISIVIILFLKKKFDITNNYVNNIVDMKYNKS
jgi:uncharacterized membrane protein YoaK (UPF0700 family)